jgi:catechol-2,3-dioxygenase
LTMGILTTAAPIAFVLTRDRAISKPFYSDILGLTLVAEDEYSAIYDLHGTVMRLTTVEDHQPSAHTVIGWSVPDIVAASQALADKGVIFSIYPGFGQDALGIWTSPDGASKINWFNDPEGNVLSLKQG